MEHKANNCNFTNATWNGTEVNMDAFHLLIYPCPCTDGGCTKNHVARNSCCSVLMCCLYKVFMIGNETSLMSIQILFGN